MATAGGLHNAATPRKHPNSPSHSNVGPPPPSEELRAEIEDVFRMFDDDDSGAIDTTELISAVFTITGEKIPRDEALAIIARYDRTHSGTIDRAGFESMVLERLRGRGFQEETARAFKLLEDAAMPGYITRDSLRRAAVECGERLTEEELAEMFALAVTGLGAPSVDFATFYSIQYAAQHGVDEEALPPEH